MYNVLDLFAGCGGLSSGFTSDLDFNINLANDIWKPAKETYTFNHPDIPFILDDIKNLSSDILNNYFPDGIDVIIGGPPCQGFSMCGTRDIDDERNKLFYEYARIVDITRPYLFIMENVKGLLSMKNRLGNLIIDVIEDVFNEIGYNIDYKVINSKYYGVPQSRERVIIVGTRKDMKNKFEYPKKNTNVISVGEALEGLTDISSVNGECTINNYSSNYVKSLVKSKKIYNHEIPVHKKDVVNRMAYVPHGGNWRDIPEEHRVGGTHSNAYKRLDPKLPSVTIKHAYKSMIIHPWENRCLSVREVARLQSFNDDFIFKDSKTSQYQQLANAVPPNLSKALAISAKDFLDNIDKNNVVDKRKNFNEQISFF